ncbi:MAG: hypothetical protein AB7O26_10350 [Planctomycetaceae bacterium]
MMHIPTAAALLSCATLFTLVPMTASADGENPPAASTSETSAVKTATPAEAASTAPAALPVAPGLQPYRIRAWVAFEPDPSLTPQFQEAVRARISVRLATIFGATTDFSEGIEVLPAPWLAPMSRTGLLRLSEERIRSEAGTTPIDKGFVIVVARDGSRLTLVGREWDASRRSLGEAATFDVWNRDSVADSAAELLYRLFQPICMIENVESDTKKARITIRAGALPMGEPDRKLLAPGDALVTFLRYFDKQQELRSVQPIPWTYLVVDEIDGSRAHCSLVSGIRAPLGTNRRRRVESCAIRLKPTYSESELRLLQANSSKPLGAHRVIVTPRTAKSEKTNDAPLLTLMTDRDGRFQLPADPQNPVVWMTIRSGEALLAHVPYVPGTERESVMQIPDDALRLGVERELDLLKGRLIEAVAQRATISTRALAAARTGNVEDAKKILTEIDNLPKLAEFESQLTAIRIPAVEMAQKRKDRLGEARIKRISDQAADLIRQYLADDRVRRVREEVDQLVEAAKNPPPAKPAGKTKARAKGAPKSAK